VVYQTYITVRATWKVKPKFFKFIVTFSIFKHPITVNYYLLAVNFFQFSFPLKVILYVAKVITLDKVQ